MTLGARIGARAAISVTLIAGFYVLIGTVLLGLAVCLGLLVGLGGWAMLGAFVLYVLLIGVAAGLGRGLQAPKFEPHGTRLLEADQPELWALVRDLAERVDTRPPDEIWLLPEVNAAVWEQTTWLGLRGGRRLLLLGVPVLLAMSAEQLCAVVAHELGHYSHSHTRLAAINQRGRVAVAGAYVKLKRLNPLRWLFVAYARLYFLVEAAVSRQQELEADQAAARIAGRAAAQSALVEVGVLSSAWELYVGRYVTAALPFGLAPARVFRGFPEFLDACRNDLAELREHVGHAAGSRWDSHPPTRERVAALAGAPEIGVHSDPRPAWQLLSDPDALVEQAEREAFDFGDRRLLDWPEYVAEGVRVEAEQRADTMYRALSRVTGRKPEQLDTVLAACEQGEFDELWQRMQEAHAPDGGVSAAVVTAALRSGAARIEHRFDGDPRLLLTTDGTELDVDALLKPLLDGGGPAVAGVRAALRAAGVDLAQAKTRQLRDDGAFAENLGALPDVKLDGEWKDLVVTTDGLVFRPGPENRSQDVGKRRLTQLLAETTAQQLIADPRNLWIPYDEMASATVRREIPVHAEIQLYDGAAYEIREAIYGSPVGNAREILIRFLSALATTGSG
ncbi:M48 family metallopeptidase [Flindersiella endophytica]